MQNEDSPVARNRLHIREVSGFRFYFRGGTVDEHVLKPDYQQFRFFAAAYHPRETDTILDVGAHIGIFTALAARRVPRGAVYAIEGAGENFDILLKNVTANGLSNVRPHRIVLGDRNGYVKLYHADANWGHSVLSSSLRIETASSEVVASRTLETFLAANGINHVDYMKMNVEGAEYDILLKAPMVAVQAIDVVLVECHPTTAHCGEELVEWLRMCGFTADVAWSEDEPGKGWITAHSPAAAERHRMIKPDDTRANG